MQGSKRTIGYSSIGAPLTVTNPDTANRAVPVIINFQADANLIGGDGKGRILIGAQVVRRFTVTNSKDEGGDFSDDSVYGGLTAPDIEASRGQDITIDFNGTVPTTYNLNIAVRWI